MQAACPGTSQVQLWKFGVVPCAPVLFCAPGAVCHAGLPCAWGKVPRQAACKGGLIHGTAMAHEAKRQKRRERGRLATSLEMLCPVACLSGLARRRFAKGVLSTDRYCWCALPIPEPTAQKDVGEQEQDIVAAPRATPKFTRSAPKTKGELGSGCSQGMVWFVAC